MMAAGFAMDKIPGPQVAALGDEIALDDEQFLGTTMVMLWKNRPGFEFDVEEHVVPSEIGGQDLDPGTGVRARGPLSLSRAEEAEAVVRRGRVRRAGSRWDWRLLGSVPDAGKHLGSHAVGWRYGP
jgi:hypothetical protein